MAAVCRSRLADVILHISMLPCLALRMPASTIAFRLFWKIVRIFAIEVAFYIL